MRILFLPNITKTKDTKDLMLDSNYKLLYDIRGEFGDDVYAYWVLPHFLKNAENALDPQRNMVIYETFETDAFDMRDDYVDTKVINTFARRYGDYLIDAVITTRKGAPVELLKLNDIYRRNDVIGDDHTWMPVFMIDPNAWELHNFKDLINAIAYVASVPIFLTDLEKKKAVEYAGRYFNGSVLRRLQEKAIVAPMVFDFDRIDAITGDIEKSDHILKIFYGARINKYKRTDLIMNAYGYLMGAGRENLEFIVTTITAESSAYHFMQMQKWGKFYRFYPNCNWDTYLSFAKSSHISLVASHSEALSASFVETLYLGVLLILPDKDWIGQLVPKDYPFVYRDQAEMHGMLDYVVDHYAEAKAQVAHIPAYIREKFHKVRTTYYLIQEIRRAIQHHRDAVYTERLFTGSQAPLAKVIGLQDSLTWDEIIERTHQHFRLIRFPQSTTFRRREYFTNYELYLHLLQTEGFMDACDAPQPHFVRRNALIEALGDTADDN